MNKVLLFIILTSVIMAQSSNSIPIMVSTEACMDYRIIYPWDDSKTLTFEMPTYALVNISIYSMKGEFISDLAHEYMKPGKNTVAWNGKNSKGKSVKHDVFFHVCRIE